MRDRCARTASAYPAGALMPVPIAVAPMLISRISACASPSRSTSSRIVWPNAVNSCPSVIGTASCSCVRPILMCGANSSPLARKAAARSLIARAQPLDLGVQRQLHRRRIDVVGGLAEVDVVVRVHELVLARARGRTARARGSRSPRSRSCWSRCPRRPGSCPRGSARGGARRGSRAPRARSAPPRPADSSPSSAFASAAASFTAASASISAGNSRSGTPVIGKFSSARSVCTPYSASSGTSRSPSRSCSMRVRAAAEAERAPAADERRVDRREPVRDRPGRAADERRVERGRLAGSCSATCSRVSRSTVVSLSARAVVPCTRVVEQQSLAHRLAGAKRGEADRATVQRASRSRPPRRRPSRGSFARCPR